MVRLGVNIDHVATLRQARRGREPDPIWAAVEAELGGADLITVHLREDRRHIQDRDLRLLRETVKVPLNLELAAVPEILRIACEVRPDQATLVPERRQEITTEGGLDVVRNERIVADAIRQLQGHGIRVAVFIDPDPQQIELSKAFGAEAVEIQTARYSEARNEAEVRERFAEVCESARYAHEKGLAVHMGHGLNYHNVRQIAAIPCVQELNIGHSIVSRAVFVGLRQAVAEMKRILEESRRR
ncbi:MAG: pyridoxine 5'-phosphate synthase [Gemmatales bacterium]|nr:pyridoxine 5'-phosphate synthase [Gemmatales bacterium]MDW8385797.1 pyridoxine 5'-phosphate synthase [Gemmatales bacterium]